MFTRRGFLAAFSAAAAGFSVSFSSAAAPKANALAVDTAPISLRTMGSFFFGGTVAKLENGETFHGDHGYAQYYIAENSRTLPIVMWHGIGQSGKTYESTPDGREGYQALLPRHDWSVYIVDQPRRGRAGYTMAKSEGPTIPTTARESGVWSAFRNGDWKAPEAPTIYSGSQFPLSGAALFDRIGDGILMTHSNSGQYGWEIAMASPHVKAVVAYEPGACAFPEEEPPAPVEAATELVASRMFPRMVPMQKWQALTKVPILIVFGDYIKDKPSEVFNEDVWRIARERARQFVELVNRHGGDATLVELPKLGIRGNTHAAFADRNNLEVLAQLEGWLHEKGLDGRALPHLGPKPVEMPMTIPLETREN